MELKITFLSGPRADTEVLVTKFPYRIGRESTGNQQAHGAVENDLVLDFDRSISAVHCTLEVLDNALVLRDHRSTAGTWVNHERVDEQVILVSGTTAYVRMGKCLMWFGFSAR